MARRGFDVTGVDRTASYLEEAESRARSEGLDVEWVEADMREFRRENTFDLAVLLYSSLGFFESREENRRVLEHGRASLRSGAPLVLEMASKETMARNFHPRTWDELDDGSVFLEERRPTEGWKWMENRWIRIHPDGRRESFELRFRLYAGSELERLLRDAGFGSVDLYGSLEGRPYDREANRLVAVARED
jgi:ubiquinone/menaquinone biosynthesis C-methylase UbiE